MTLRLALAVVAAAALLTSSLPAHQAPQSNAAPRFRVAVDVVRIDAVVTDREGQIVPDLTAADFEVLQNGKRQTVTFAQFVRISHDSRHTTRPGSQVIDPSPRSGAVPVAPPASLTQADVQRSLAIVIDDLGMSVESLYYAKRGLHSFVEDHLRPADLAGILRTGGSIGSLQPFTTDRRILHSAIDRLRWNGFSRSGVEPFDPINEWTTFDDRTAMADATDFAALNSFRRSVSASGTLGALQLAIRAARDLPGRKAVLFVSEGFQMFNEDGADTRVRAAVDRLIDQATRAGVVIYSLDPRGLQTGGLQASDDLKRPRPGQTMDQTVRAAGGERLAFNRDTQESLVYIAERTGGFAVLNTNNLAAGLGRITADIRDYYILGYVPDATTFAGQGKKPQFHKLTVTVRRPGLRVKTRKEFLGVSDPEDVPTSPTLAQTLVDTAISPFATTEIALAATTLPGYEPDRGLFVRTLLHIDARALTFREDAAGKKSAAADVLGMVFDQDGTEVAHLSTGFAVALAEDATEEALRAGLVYTLRVPIPRAGAYQLRFAVRDQYSGRLGNAGEFVELPDITKGVFALSGIVLRGEDEAASAASDPGTATLTAAQALRNYRAGSELSYGYEVYNGAHRFHATTTIWRGTQKVVTLPSESVAVPAGGSRRFSVGGRLKLGDTLPPGNYVLQVSAVTAEPRQPKKVRAALQRIQFDVRLP